MKKWRDGACPYIVCLSVLLAAIVVGFIACGIYVRGFNAKDRVSVSSDPSEDCLFEMYPRNGDSDQWSKESLDKGLLYGIVYRGKFTNTGTCTVSDWSVRINIHEDCYINSDWNGEAEVHQHTPSGERVQRFDLRQYASTTVTLNKLNDPDLLIPLKEGDYVIYYPSSAEKEYPVEAAPKGEEAHSVLPGFIFYTDTAGPMEFTDMTVSYHLHKTVMQMPAFWWLIVASGIWVVLVIVFVAVRISIRQAQKRIMQDEVIIEQSISVLTKFVDAKDEYTNGHSYRVARYARLIGEKLGYTSDQCRHLFYIALMHDCGKVGVPDSILKKPDRLTDDEYEAIKMHTTRGAELLKDFTAIADIRDGALYHHERYDGKGYPTGKSGEDIPMVGRIICVADSFDAMNSHRCYRSRRSKEYIISELENNKGKQFDPRIVDIFLELIRDGSVEIGEFHEDE